MLINLSSKQLINYEKKKQQIKAGERERERQIDRCIERHRAKFINSDNNLFKTNNLSLFMNVY